MAAAALLLVVTLVALGSGHGGEAFDPNPLQDFCVADATSKGKKHWPCVLLVSAPSVLIHTVPHISIFNFD